MFRTDKLPSPPNKALASSQVKPTKSSTTTPRRGPVSGITTDKFRENTPQIRLTGTNQTLQLTCQSHDSPFHRPAKTTKQKLEVRQRDFFYIQTQIRILLKILLISIHQTKMEKHYTQNNFKALLLMEIRRENIFINKCCLN